MEASRQGNTIQPIHFNSEAYKASEVYQLKGQAEQQTIDYLTFKKNQEEVRKQQAEIEAEIEARKREEAEFARLNPIEKSLHSFKEIGTDFWDSLEARNEKKFDSIYDFGNYLTVGSFDTTKALFQGMEDRANVAMNSPYDFVNYVSMGTLDLGNGAINPEESFSKEHWLSSIGLASILVGGAKPIVPKSKTPSLQDRNLVLEKTVNKAHELTMKTKADVNFVVDEVRGGINVLLNALHNHENLDYSPNVSVPKIPMNVMDTESVKKVLDRVWSKFSLSGVGKGKVDKESGGFRKLSLDNIEEFVKGNKNFEDVLEDYANLYAETIKSNEPWSWGEDILGAENLTLKQKRLIKEQAISDGHIPQIPVNKVAGMRYGFADFAGVGLVEEIVYLPEEFWKLSDKKQFTWLDEQIGGHREGMTWHHTEIPGKMELVPYGIHNITPHNGGRTTGMWADAPR
ncbi:HNH endonuclease [Metabacillus litoralis]|uniref:HNH endonuclease signature motif containing protein n=1 Tax=Metabacillus litoralis TaxID=152268 RepID=UPI00203C1145|nr:HNH endonuclease [Metabacillus litoralis]MCM3654330.1 HNH endonuclease [Metabacillus litoralis]